MGTMDPKEKFYRQFQNAASDIQQQIDLLPSKSTVGGELMYAIEDILGRISRLSNEVADAADFVPAYDHRAYSEVVKSLRDQVTEAQDKLKPKSRFQFKQRGPASSAAAKPDTRRLNPAVDNNNHPRVDASPKPTEAGSLPGSNTTATSNSNTETTASDGKPTSTLRDLTLTDHSRVHITLPATASRAVSGWTLTNFDRCVVDISAPTTAAITGNHDNGSPFASLTIKDVAGSVIVAGHVDGPVHVTAVRDSVVVVAARQVRIHDCENVVFYLHCVSRPIVEDCKGVRFAKAPGCYLNDKQKGETNLFDQVDDFKWLKATPSPNWSVLPEEEVVPEGVWMKTLVGGPGAVIEDTLRTLGAVKRD